MTDYTQFESLCHDLMAHLGYKNIEPLGAFADKGRDAIHVNKAGQTTIFAYSVREDWQKKLEEDASKIRDHGHKCDEMVFVTTGNVTASDRDKTKARIKNEYGWALRIFGLERLRIWLDGDCRDIRENHPQIFDPRLWSEDTQVFTVPYPRHNCFKGRADVLTELRRTLVEGGKAALTQVIRGLGGIGKTQTAVEYAYQHKDDYRAVLWIKAETSLDLTDSLAGAASRLGLTNDDTKPDQAVRELMNWLEHNSDWLLIFDNADHPGLLKPFMPRSADGHILLTSRASGFAALNILDTIELPLLSPEHATEFLLERTGLTGGGDAEVESARELATELGLLPLALEQAGANIQELRLSFAAYLERYRKRRLELLERGKPAMGDYPESVATTWSVNFEEVGSESPASADLLRLSAFLAPDNIPLELVVTGAPATECALAESISKSDDREFECREALRQLTRFSLVSIDAENDTYSIHRLVQEAIKHTLDESARRTWAERAIHMVNAAFPGVEFENWDLCKRLVPHAVVVAKHAADLAICTDDVARLANEAGYFFKLQAQFTETEPLYKQ